MQIIESLLVFLSTFVVVNHEGPTYTTLQEMGDYEVRKYDPWIVAETIVEGSHENVGTEAFHILAGYIFGKNDQDIKIDMTAPVTEFETSPGKYTVQFFMPAKWTLETLPKPLDERVVIKQLPERKMFVLRYQGSSSESHYERELVSLNHEVNFEDIKLVDGAKPIWARYNSPMMPQMLRTNEIMYEME